MLRVAAATSPGLVRPSNEDRASIDGNRVRDGDAVEVELPGERGVVLVADGMGGHARGDVASDVALSELEHWERDLFLEASCRSALQAANRAVYDAAGTKSEFHGMGSTIVGVAVQGSVARWFNVGDSRAYLYRNGKLVQLSTDHVPVTGRPVSHAISQSLGGGHFFVEVVPSTGEISLKEGDEILLCSDGLTDVVGNEEMEALLIPNDLKITVRSLLALCMARGAPDNVTVALLRWTKQAM